MNIVELDRALKAVCPVDGVSIGDPKDKRTWHVDFREEATDKQRSAAKQVLDAAPDELDLSVVSIADPVEKMRAFLLANPDVAKLIT